MGMRLISRWGMDGTDAARFGDDAGDAEPDIVGALVAHDLKGQAGAGRALDGGRAIGIHEVPGERGEEAGRGGAEADADDIDIHRLAERRRLAHAG